MCRQCASRATASGFDVGSPANIAPVVVWLASAQSAGITGRVFTVKGGEISVAETWVKGPTIEKPGRWEPEELGDVTPRLWWRGHATTPASTEAPRP